MNKPIWDAAFPDVNGALEVHLDQCRDVGAVLVDEGISKGDSHHGAGLDAHDVANFFEIIIWTNKQKIFTVEVA